MRLLLTLLLLVSANISFGQSAAKLEPFLLVTKVIPDIQNAMQRFKNKVDIPVTFPRFIPANSAGEHISFNSISRQHYIISMSEQSDCNGANYCTIGSVTAEVAGRPSIHYDMQNRELTVPVMLGTGQRGYYTPGYALASSSPPQLCFRCKNVLYTVAWRTGQVANVKLALIRLAEATILNANQMNELRCQ